jgi:hypothetical protein
LKVVLRDTFTSLLRHQFGAESLLQSHEMCCQSIPRVPDQRTVAAPRRWSHEQARLVRPGCPLQRAPHDGMLLYSE